MNIGLYFTKEARSSHRTKSIRGAQCHSFIVALQAICSELGTIGSLFQSSASLIKKICFQLISSFKVSEMREVNKSIFFPVIAGKHGRRLGTSQRDREKQQMREKRSGRLCVIIEQELSGTASELNRGPWSHQKCNDSKCKNMNSN